MKHNNYVPDEELLAAFIPKESAQKLVQEYASLYHISHKSWYKNMPAYITFLLACLTNSCSRLPGLEKPDCGRFPWSRK